MAKRKSAVPRSNVANVTIGDIELELEASLGTDIEYSNEFLGKLDEPYNGVLDHDMLVVWSAYKPTVEMTVLVDDEGKFVFDDEGKYVFDPNGKKVELPNQDYRGIDVLALLRIAWAMAYAAGSTKKRFDGFLQAVIHQPAGIVEEASLFSAVIVQLGGGIIFRRPEGLGGSEQADETQEG